MFYRVIAGSYRDKKNAEEMVAKLKNSGVSAFIMPFESEVSTMESKYYEVNGLKVIETTADNIKIAKISDTLGNRNGINGTFFWNNNTIGIAVNDKKRLDPNSHVAHDYLQYKRGTVYYKDGKMFVDRIYDIRPYNPDWAISGVMLYPNYNPTIEGFTGQYADVLRKTNHTAIGFKGNKIYLIVQQNVTLNDFRINILNSPIAFDGLVNLDGGGSTQINYNGKGLKASRKVTTAVLLKED